MAQRRQDGQQRDDIQEPFDPATGALPTFHSTWRPVEPETRQLLMTTYTPVVVVAPDARLQRTAERGDTDQLAMTAPFRALLLLHFALLPTDAEPIVGDLVEKFARRRREFGPRIAYRWFWWQAVRTVYYYQIDVRRFVKWAWVVALLEVARRRLGL